MRRLIVFAKVPRVGAVKTRLARDIGSVAAWVWYRRTLATLLHRLGRDRRWRPILAIAGPHRHRIGYPRAQFWVVSRQSRGDLGRRMTAAFAGGKGPTVLVGSDIPDLASSHIIQSFQALGRSQVVLGPATDGGFWLVGLRHPRRSGRLFRAVRWSTPFALADTLANLDPRDSATLLAPLADLDDGNDLRTWRARGDAH